MNNKDHLLHIHLKELLENGVMDILSKLESSNLFYIEYSLHGVIKYIGTYIYITEYYN